MKYNFFKTKKTRSAKRVGRGISAGQGKTAGRGTKGQNSRAGSTRRLGFEGGQNPLIQRTPKLRGFKSHKKQPIVIYTDQLNNISGTVVDNNILSNTGFLEVEHQNIKLVSRGKLNKKLNVKLHSASKQAIKQIESAGGVFEKINRRSVINKEASKKHDEGK